MDEEESSEIVRDLEACGDKSVVEAVLMPVSVVGFDLYSVASVELWDEEESHIVVI